MRASAVWISAAVLRAPPTLRPARSTTAPRLSGAANGDDELREKLGEMDVDLGTASSAASRALAEMEEKMAARLRSMGASEAPPPETPKPARSEFKVSRATEADAEDIDARLRRLRAQGLGELEGPNAAAIDGARKMAREWVRAALAERAERELRDVAKFVSYRTDVGADFHLQLAEVLDLCARKTEASRMRMRVQREAESSSARWQAKRALAGPDAARARERSGEQELGQLFQMPDRWD